VKLVNDFEISVIVPTWNEAEQLPRTLEAVRANCGRYEVIVVDADSTDGTPRIAEQFGSRVLISPVAQRACQLNQGASRANGDIFLFLHADTLLPGNAFKKVLGALHNPAILGGAFVRKFDSRSVFLRLTCLAAEIRNRLIGWHLGDQAIFCRRSAFESSGGFKEIGRFEDLDFSRRLGRMGKIATLRPPVITSARRFKKDGPLLRTWRDFLLTIDYLRRDPAAWRKRESAGRPGLTL
jgi:rSAM/selenodomain-associated transferase 2